MNTPITLEENLAARDKRLQHQKRLLGTFQKPLICFTLNIAGPLKLFPLSLRAFNAGVTLITERLQAFGFALVHRETYQEKTGCSFFCVTDGRPLAIKAQMIALEESESIGRIFDIDVLAVNGEKIARETLGYPQRKCLICSQNAFVCGRSRAHSLDALLQETCLLMDTWLNKHYAQTLATTCTRALLYEVTTAPKPGLVDRFDTGANDDMDIFTFQDSALALTPYFEQCVLQGTAHTALPLPELFEPLRQIGLQAEFAMLKATKGINTHKGLIFSAALLCGALGYLYPKDQAPTAITLAKTCQGLTKPLHGFYHGLRPETAKTHGEELYLSHGITGARGEACAGFPTLFNTALPAFKNHCSQGLSLNDAGTLTLLEIMATTDDTNSIARSSYDTMVALKNHLKKNLPLSPQNRQMFLTTLNQKLIDQNINPGGSADLLALTYFMYFLGI